MEITVNIPEKIGDRLEQNWGYLPQKILEALAVEAYQNGVLTVYQVQQLLNLDSRWQTENFLSDRRAYIDYDLADLDNDLNTLNQHYSIKKYEI